MAVYDYDGAGLLAAAWDPRISPALKTAYSYDADGRLATITPPGQAPWALAYNAAGQLTSVSRPDAANHATATSTVVYCVPFTATATPWDCGTPASVAAPIDMGAAATATWGQTGDLPARAAGVFGPDHNPAGTAAADLTAEDWRHAGLYYIDGNGREVNTASWANDAWQITTDQYDQQGNDIWSLTAENRDQALDPTDATAASVAAMPDPAGRADALATVNAFSADGTVLVDALGPTHPVALADIGTVADARTHTHTDYDQGAPNGNVAADGGPHRLPTTVTATAQTADGVEHDPSVAKTGYDAVRAGDPTGWSLRLATSQTDPGGLVTQTRYDAAGRVVETVLPNNGANAGVRTTLTAYYTATGTGGCVSAVQAGWVCSTGPAAQPDSGAPLPVAAYTWDGLGDLLAKTETFGAGASAVVRVTAGSFDAAGRRTGESITVTPAGAGGAPVPAVSFGYDGASGLPTTTATVTGGAAAVLTTGFDGLGRAVSYTDAAGNVSTTAYDLSGRVAAVDDGKGTTTYGYDPYSGRLVSLDAGTGSLAGRPGGFTASYDGGGNLTTVTYPNGIVADTVYDNAGQPVSLTYTGTDGQVWFSFAQSADAQGRTVAQSGPGSSQVFGYDGSGRLVKVEDTTSDPDSG
ncbi:MAG: sugar-binding protein, partial [Actinomycetia bacterium]|nr:sugar-binding protein [Actinomycetes bacterium]